MIEYWAKICLIIVNAVRIHDILSLVLFVVHEHEKEKKEIRKILRKRKSGCEKSTFLIRMH